MAGAIFGAALGVGTSILNNNLAAQRADIDRAENHRYGELAAQAADRRTRALYNDFYSPKAMLKQYEEAGLSPSIMFGGTPGQGGMSGAMGTATQGIQTPYMPISLLEGAQVAKLAAETEKTKAETKQIEPIANATVSSLLADSGYKKAAEAAAAAQAAGQELLNYITENTKEASIYTICERAEQAGYESSKAYYEMKDAKLLNQFNQEVFEDRKKIMHTELEQLIQSIAESKSVENLNKQQIHNLKVAIIDSIDNANREWAKYDLNVEQFETFLKKQIPIMEKELTVKLEELGIQKSKLIIDAVTDTFKSLAMGAVAASSVYGKGGNLTPTPQQIGIKPIKGGNAINKGVPIHKNNNIWSY